MHNIDIETLTAHECVNLIRQVSIGRIGATIGALPVVLPVNFAFVNGAIVFPAAPGTKLATATDHTVVAFEVDSYEGDCATGWSVLVQGVADAITDPAELETARAALAETRGVNGQSDRVVRIDPQMVNGRRFVRENAV